VTAKTETHDKITVGVGELTIHQANYGRIFRVPIDSIQGLDSSHIGTTYVIRKGRCTNLFVGKSQAVVERAIAEAKRRLDAIGDRQLSFPGSDGPDEF
jgi:hypothetical protein